MVVHLRNTTNAEHLPITRDSGGSTLTTVDKTAIGLSIPLTIIALLQGAMFYIARKKIKATRRREDLGKANKDTQPYLQQKAELEDEETRKRKLEGDTVHEMQAGGESAQELSTDDRRFGLPSLKLRHELVGEEFARELEVI